MAANILNGSATQAAPWDAVPPSKQFFALVTGANSGVGLGISQRLIDEFLTTRSLDAHIVIIASTRSTPKAHDAIRDLRRHVVHFARSSDSLRARYGGNAAYRWQDVASRVHILSPHLDLCDLRSIRTFANRLCSSAVGNPPGIEGEYLHSVRIPRIDCIICNAAFGGWSGFSLPVAIWHLISRGIIQSVTWPEFKIAMPTLILNENSKYGYPDKPLLGEVFCACVFGHYFLTHQLLPLLSRSSTGDDEPPPGRIIWTSSIEAVKKYFFTSDLQCFIRPTAYESVKRLTDILALTSTLPSVRGLSRSFFSFDNHVDNVSSVTDGGDADDAAKALPVSPRMYVMHPGIVVSAIFPVPWFLFWAYRLAVYLSRWLGSPWHCATGYNGATAATWLALESQSALDELDAERVKWGSSADRRGNCDVKKTEVEGWGWEGKVESPADLAADPALGLLRKTIGRKNGVVDTTDQDIAEFEEQGVRVWTQMEQMRIKWSEILEAEDEDEQ